MMRCARAVSSHRLGSSASVFSSASRAFALSKSKVPPQQSDRPLDVFNDTLNFRAHDAFRLWHLPPKLYCAILAAQLAACSGCARFAQHRAFPQCLGAVKLAAWEMKPRVRA
jgi:hypothetical protein